jgi:hypothetical protein
MKFWENSTNFGKTNIMTSKEKAEQLIFYYQNLLEPYFKNINSLRNKSIQCALIAVDEIILSRKDDSQFDDTLWAGGSDMYTMHPMYLNYWLEVKQEIENL